MLVELKRVLEAAHSALLGELLATLRALLKDHKAEVGSALALCILFRSKMLYQYLACCWPCCTHCLRRPRCPGVVYTSTGVTESTCRICYS